MNTLKISLSLIFILFVFTPCIYADETAPSPTPIPIYTYDSPDQPITFPPFLKLHSPVIERMMDGRFKEAKEKKIILRSIHSNVLRELKECMDLLAKAARDTEGKPVSPEKINQDTIFVHSLLEESLYKKLNKMENFKLKQLSQTAHFLLMDRFLDVFSYVIAKRIHTKAYTLTDQQEFDQYMRVQWRWITDEQYQYINEYLYLIKYGKQKQTIADYIGLHGQPYFDQRIDLKNKGLTSLQGIELLKGANTTTTFLLNENFILDASVDPNFPQRPFRHFQNLACLYLSRNQFTQLPENLFHDLSLKWLYLNNNQLKHIHTSLLQGQQHLKTVSLSFNQLDELPEGLLSHSPQLENFFVSHNLITKMPKLFHGCSQLRNISLASNRLIELPEQFFEYQGQLESMNLCENPKITFPPTLFQSLTQLQRLFLEEEQKKGLTIEQRQNLQNVVIPIFCPDTR